MTNHTTTRSDTHRPSAIDPGDYTYITDFYQGPSEDIAHEYRTENGVWEDECPPVTWFEGNFASRGTCDHCGARFLYGVAYLHEPTGDVVNVGHTCAMETMDLPSSVALKRHRAAKAAKAARAKLVLTEKRLVFLADRPELAEALAYFDKVEADIEADIERLRPTGTMWDIVGGAGRKIAGYGHCTSRHAATVVRMAGEHAEREAARRKEADEATEVPEGRYEVRGEVLTTKWQDNDFGGSLKMLVRDDRNFKVWGTVPNAIWQEAERGARVSFVARVERSDRDRSFGFYTRPTKAQVLTPAPEEAE